MFSIHTSSVDKIVPHTIGECREELAYLFINIANKALISISIW